MNLPGQTAGWNWDSHVGGMNSSAQGLATMPWENLETGSQLITAR